MKKLFKEYKRFISRFPEAYLGERHERIEKGLEIYTRTFYKTKGNREIILKMLESEDLTTNQVAFRMNMTRQGARQHIKQLEKENKLVRKGYVGRKNVLYGVKKC